MTSPEERLASLETNHSNIKEDIAEIKTDLKMVLEALNQSKGAWKIAAGAGAAVAGFVTIAAKKLGLS